MRRGLSPGLTCVPPHHPPRTMLPRWAHFIREGACQSKDRHSMAQLLTLTYLILVMLAADIRAPDLGTTLTYYEVPRPP